MSALLSILVEKIVSKGLSSLYSIKKTDVEVYVEDVKAGTHSNGIYSVLYDKWVRFPEEDTNDYDTIYNEVKSSEDYINLVNEINQVLSNGNSTDIKEELNKVYLIRKEALDSKGELGLGNIMFKLLRSEGYLDKLRGDYYETRSRELTIEGISDMRIYDESNERV
jgi:hypothetical protein